MRVAYLSSLYPAVSHTFIRREVQALRQRGVEVHTFSLRRTADADIYSEEDRSERNATWSAVPTSVRRLVREHAAALAHHPAAYVRTLRTAWRHRTPGLRAAVWSVFYFGEAVLLARELERRDIHHLHCHFSNAGGHVGYLATRFLDIGWSLTLHGGADFDEPGRVLIAAKVAASRFTVCISHYGRAITLQLCDPQHWDRVFVSRCGVDASRLPQPADAPESRGARRLRVLGVGRLVAHKGFVGLVQAFAGVIDAGIDAELRIIGEGSDRPRIEGEVVRLGLGDRVSLPGAADEETVLQEMTHADLFVMSSFMEGLPVVLMEAMALGVPVIAPRLAGIPELVEDGTTGLLYHPAHFDELAQRMVQLLRSPDEVSALVARGRERVMQQFEIQHAIEPLYQRLHSVLSH